MKKVNIILLSLAAVLSIGTATFASSYKNTIETSAAVGNYSTDAATYYNGITATSGDALLAQLHDLMCTTHQTYTTYDDCKTPAYVYAMEPGSSSSYIMDFYTQKDIGYSWGSGATGTWNREHVWCQSQSKSSAHSDKELWGKSYGGSDFHHLRPVESSLNTARNNNRFGEFSSLGLNRDSYKAYSKNTNKQIDHEGGYSSQSYDIYEPFDSVKGDVARILLYVYTHYTSYHYITGATTDGSLVNGTSVGKLEITNIVRTASGSGTTDDSAFEMLLAWNTSDPVSDAERVRNEQAAKYQGNRNPFIDHPEYANAIWGNTTANTVTLSSTSGSVAIGSTLVINATSTQSGTFGCSSANTSIATVKGSYNLSTSKYDVTITGKAVGTTTITVSSTYNSVQSTTTFTVTVYNPSATKTLSSISLSGDYPTEFTVGDTFSHSGMTVTANYSDSTSADVTSSATFSGYDMTTTGVQEVTVSYTESGTTKTLSYYITVSNTSTSNSFELYSGALTEGDYIVYYNEKAMKASVSSERLSYESVTPSNDIIATTDTSIIWHISASGSYWTLYNAAEAKYAASTDAKNKAQLLADGTDDKSLWTVTGTSTYEFVNKQNTASSVNANLRNNGTYGFACYSTSTGGALSLYRRTSLTPVSTSYENTYDANGGVGTMKDDDSPYDSGDTVIVLTNTFTRDGYLFDHWNTASDNTGTSYDEGDEFTISSNVTLYAQWVENAPVVTSTTYVKVTNVSDLEENDHVVIVADDYDYALGAQRSNNFGQVEIEKTGNTIQTVTDIQIFRLKREAGDAAGVWMFSLKVNSIDNYIYAAGSSSSNNNYLRVLSTISSSSKFLVTIQNSSTTIVAQDTKKNNELKYNNSSGLFSCYGSGNTQKAVSIYKLVTDCANKWGKSFVNTVTCNGGTTAPSTINWNTMKTSYNALDISVKSVISGATANESGTYYEKAVARYDYIISKYGSSTYENYMSRSISNSGQSPLLLVINTNSDNTLILIITIISLSAIGLYIVKLRKRYNNK